MRRYPAGAPKTALSTRRAAALLMLAIAGAMPLGSAAAQAAPHAGDRAASGPPRLIVFLNVDQLIPAYFDRFGEQFTGGLGRLHRNGAYFTNASLDHAVTETAPGHASSLSGRFPRSTGIASNSLGVFDEQAPVIGGGAPGASPFRFRGTVLYDWMRMRDPAARALSVSRKDRGAIYPMGRAGRDVYWYANDGRMTTSIYYRDTLPAWVHRFNARRIPQSHAGRRWTLLLPESAYPEPDSVIHESYGQNIAFPHQLTDDTSRVGAGFAGFPWHDEMLLQFALEGVRELGLGAGDRTDLLAVSLSATDAIGHRWGPDSREMHDHILRLDRALGTFIDSLYRVRDSATVAFALTSDHGVASYPEVRAQSHSLPVLRADTRPVLQRVAAQLEARDIVPQAVRLSGGMLFVSRERVREGGLDPDSLARAVAAELRRVPGVARVDEVQSLAGRDTATDVIARRWLNALPPDFEVPFVVTLHPGTYWAPGTSATHGTPHDYDAHVPVIFYGPWFTPGQHAGFVRVVDMAPTLAHVIGVVPAEPLDGRVLAQALHPALRPAPGSARESSRGAGEHR